MKKTVLYVSLALVLANCTEMPPEVYANRGDPENMMNVTTEAVNIRLDSGAGLMQLSRMVAQEPPSRATLGCDMREGLCSEARDLLQQQNVPVSAGSATDDVALIYDRVSEQTCENRFIDNSINPYNLHHPAFGCSVVSNTMTMVSDKRQILAPNLLEFQDGEKSEQIYERYQQPPQAVTGGGISSLVQQ